MVAYISGTTGQGGVYRMSVDGDLQRLLYAPPPEHELCKIYGGEDGRFSLLHITFLNAMFMPCDSALPEAALLSPPGRLETLSAVPHNLIPTLDRQHRYFHDAGRLINAQTAETILDLHNGSIWQHSIAPDGHTLALIINTGNNLNLYLWQNDTLQQLSTLQGAVFADIPPAFSADGQKIAVVVDRSFYVYELDTQRLVFIADAIALPEADMQWAPDGEWLAYRGRSSGLAPYTLNLATGRQYRIGNEEVFAPNFAWIADWFFYQGMEAAIHRARPDGTEDRILTPLGSYNRSPTPYPIPEEPWAGGLLWLSALTLLFLGFVSMLYKS